MNRLVIILIATAIGSIAAPAARAVQSPDNLAFFEKKIRPLLVSNCYNCHSANTNDKGGLRVDDRNGLLVGGDRGPVVVPGHPEKSLLIKAVTRTDPKLKMPPSKPLDPEQIADLTKWIADGVAWPVEPLPASLMAPSERYEKLRKEHWAWQPLHVSVAPQVKNAAWPRDDLDRFVLALLESKNLAPVGDADKLSLIRRVTFDLTGLPPTPEQMDAFTVDASPDAFAKVVDRLLASSAFGERWGRHWLDVARYGESTGSSRNVPYPQAWRYRDYVIDAFNHDKPYDQFIREQVAGDLLPASSQAEKDEHLIATGFLAIGVHDVNQRFKNRFILDNIDEQIDTVTRSVLAMTVSCARCHNHKFDPIPTSDYYALAGIFQSTDLCAGLRNKMGGGGLDYFDPGKLLHLVSAIPPSAALMNAKIAEATQKVEKAKAEFEKLKKDPASTQPVADGPTPRRAARERMERAQAELDALADRAPVGPIAIGVREAQTVGDAAIRIRGEAERLGPTVPRGFLSIVQLPNPPVINPAYSGRGALSKWLTSPQNPLASRVMANRIWQHLFNDGIVRSVDNFGVTGDVPSDPALLDFLARRFVSDGWSVKRLIREIVLSRTYQLSVDESKTASAIDPENRLLWRHSPRRLEAEEIRDATLAIAGKLDLSRPLGSPTRLLQVIEVFNNSPIAAKLINLANASRSRSIYLPLLRNLTPNSLGVFDFAQQGMVTGSRDVTTVATQALYLLNDPFVKAQSRNLAERLLQRSNLDEDGRIQLAYRLTLGRPPDSAERAMARDYLATYESALRGGRPALTPQSTPRPTSRPMATDAQVVAIDIPSGDGSGSGGTNANATASAKAMAPVHVEPAHDAVAQPPSSHEAAWMSFCEAILESAEFRYVR